MNAKDAWSTTLGQLQVQLNRSTYDTWLRHAELLGCEDGRFVVTVPNVYVKDWLERHLLPSMTDALSRIYRQPSEIQLIVWNPIDEVEDIGGPLFDQDPNLLPINEALDALHPDYSFEQFVIGDANRYAALLAQAIADGPIGKYSPVLFHGDMGMGKTHLLQAIARRLIERGQKVIYTTAEAFTNELVGGIRGQKMTELREKYRHADAVLIDDLQFVEGKDNTQAELIAIWDALRNRQRTIIFSSDRLPRDMVKVHKDARSRFQAGPIASLDAPDWALRQAILDHKAAQRGLALGTEVRDQIARCIVSSVRDLESAFDQIATLHQLTGQPITGHMATSILQALGTEDSTASLLLDDVLQAAANHFRLSTKDLTGRGRTKAVVYARQIAMYLTREMTALSLPQIGEAFGGRDHSTVLHGCNRIAEQLATEALLIQDMHAIRDVLARERGTLPAPVPIPQRLF